MENIISTIQGAVQSAVKKLYDLDINGNDLALSPTRKEFEGDYTIVVFPFTRAARKKPEAIAEEIGQILVAEVDTITSFNVIKGFLNLSVDNKYWNQFLIQAEQTSQFGHSASNGKKVMVEFSSPNTNKPLHLGHIRNILLGWSVQKIVAAAGYEVIKTQIVNDRGIAICKSMLAWKQFGNGETPESTGMKSDHFIGKYYVVFNTEITNEYFEWQNSEAGQAYYSEHAKAGEDQGDFFKKYKNNYFNEHSALGTAAKEMLLKWEANDPETKALWSKMNNWVYEGFNETYKNLGVDFDKLYYESDTYLLGKDIIENGIKNHVFYKKEDGSVWIDLEDKKLDHKLVLRSDGTSVYITQDIGTAEVRFQEYGMNKMVYVVGNEQEYHFKALFATLEKLGASFADGLYHLSYGMVNLPEGRMKSREGTVVDADDLMAEVIKEAKINAKENVEVRGQLTELSETEQENIFRQIGLGALKYFILKVNPKKGMVFNPKESVDMQGDTGPYIQNAGVRIKSVLRKASDVDQSLAANYTDIQTQEKQLVLLLHSYADTIKEAAESYDPSSIAQFSYNLAKGFHKFYNDLSILNASDENAKAFRVVLAAAVLKTLTSSLDLLGIELPERM